uniref:sugar-transfer associated ATP-grasp domain-containing protein n=1 Tax=uncultured Allobacillus sp. TaxID=1638025 RepID=UPI0025995173|nr:sugar-transfer associated ATP-grasp domain-containing protein [uncultured Allobacillus sp.]
MTNNTLDKYKSLGMKTKTKAFKRFSAAGLLNNVDEEYISEVNKFWKKNYKKKVDPTIHIAFKNLTGREEKKLIPPSVMWNKIIPFFNDMDMHSAYSDKNIYDILFPIPNSVSIVLKRVRGNYFDNENIQVDRNAAKDILIKNNSDLIIKPSNTNNGKGIEKLSVRDNNLILNEKEVSMDDIEKMFNDHFVVQKVIKQHSVMAAPHRRSVNTLRMVTLRWNNEIKYLLTFARFGANNDVKDNAGSGGVCLGVSDSGEFLDVAIDEKCKTYTHHPTTNYPFKELNKVPNFEHFKKFVMDLHNNIIHHDFISWDIAVGEDEEPIFIEANFRGATWIYQLATQKPLFGELTEEILDYVSDKYREGNSSRVKKPELLKFKKENKELKKENTDLKKLNEDLTAAVKEAEIQVSKMNSKKKEFVSEKKTINKEKELYKQQYHSLVESKSWKVTKPLRFFGSLKKRIFK